MTMEPKTMRMPDTNEGKDDEDARNCVQPPKTLEPKTMRMPSTKSGQRLWGCQKLRPTMPTVMRPKTVRKPSTNEANDDEEEDATDDNTCAHKGPWGPLSTPPCRPWNQTGRVGVYARWQSALRASAEGSKQLQPPTPMTMRPMTMPMPPNAAKDEEDARNATTDAHDNNANDSEDAKRPTRPNTMRMPEMQPPTPTTMMPKTVRMPSVQWGQRQWGC
jgi:hypothetical protein